MVPMGDKHTENIREQYEEAAFALLMNEYAQQQGEALLREFEEAEESLSEFPDALDESCRALMRKHFEKQRRTVCFNRIMSSTKRAASIAIAVLGVFSALIVSVEAFRNPVMNFILERHETYTAILNGDENQEGTENKRQDSSAIIYIVDAMPDGYELTRYVESDSGGLVSLFKNNAGEKIYFEKQSVGGYQTVDTEGAEAQETTVGEFEGLIYPRDGWMLLWFDTDAGFYYHLRTTAFDKETTIALGNNLAATLKMCSAE